VILIVAQSNAYLDVDPFLTRQGTELVHEDPLGHDERRRMPIRDDVTESSTTVNPVRGPKSRERARNWRRSSDGGEGKERRWRRKWIDDAVRAWRPFKCVARVAILSRGERKPGKKFPLGDKKKSFLPELVCI
jgi:hypothetical protein